MTNGAALESVLQSTSSGYHDTARRVPCPTAGRSRSQRGLRVTEALLIALALATLGAGFGLLALVETGSVAGIDLRPPAMLGAGLVILHLALTLRHGRDADQIVLPLAGLLMGLGLLLTHRVAPALASRQTNSAALALVVVGVTGVAPWPIRWLRRYRYTWASLGLLLVALTLVFGVRPSGAGPRLWLGVGPLLFQPSELLKLILVVFLASYLAERRELVAFGALRIGRLRLPPLPYLGPILAVWGLSMLLLTWQRDLGAALIFFTIFLAVLYVATSRWTYVAGSLILFVAGAWVIVSNLPYVEQRVALWLNPWSETAQGSYQVIQALIAVASGGVLGTGLGYGFPTYIPAVHTDFVFAATAEELGLAGSLALVAMYALLAYRGYHIALRSDDAFVKLLAVGIASVFGLQTLIILGGNLKLIPLTGVTLPFVSYGGSSLVTSALMAGLLLRASASVRSPPNPPLSQNAGRGEGWGGSAILRLAGLVMAAFLMIAGAVPYWGVLRAAELTARPDNPRIVEAERRLVRGRILDRDGQILALTQLNDNDIATRRYTYPSLAPVLGYWSIRHGTAGIEAAFDDSLRGEPVSPDESLEQWLYHRPRVGDDVVLTIDLGIQQVADNVLGDAKGAIVLLNAHTGAILALASHPTYDPTRIDDAFPELRDDPNRPLLNRATQGRYPPGSTFKTVTLAAALEEGIVATTQVFDDGDETLYVEGFPIRCDNNPAGVNSFDLAHAYAYSCNLTFAQIGLDLGTKAFKDYAARFRVDRDIPLEIPVSPGQLANDPTLISQVLLASTAFGQGELLVTPLNMALVAAAIANDGVMPQPHLVIEVRESSSELMRSVQPQNAALGVPVTQATARQVSEIMTVSVQDGFARRAQIEVAIVGGKTGTAQLGGASTEPHAWFIGWARALDDSPDTPTYAVAVLVENGGAGSLVATPMGREVLAAALGRSE